MPRLPTSDRRPDTRLDPYRNRAAELLRDGEIVGYALVLTEYVSTVLGGHLWWTRWTTYQEIPAVSIALFDGYRLDDYWVHPADVGDELDTELHGWARNEMPLRGELLKSRWLDPAESLEVARNRFGVESFDEAGRGVGAPEPATPPRWNKRESRDRSARPRRAR